jgi:site-specific DNA recombinase
MWCTLRHIPFPLTGQWDTHLTVKEGGGSQTQEEKMRNLLQWDFLFVYWEIRGPSFMESQKDGALAPTEEENTTLCKAVLYARFSSDNQREESIEGQRRECQEFAEKSGLTIIGEYVDRALSATSDNRPEFQRMIRDSYKHIFNVVLVWKLDRFSRNVYDSAKYEYTLEKNGVRIVSATEPISDQPEGILVKQMLIGMNAYYSKELAQKVRRGMTDNALECKFNGGVVPFGYLVNSDQRLVINPEQASVVKEVFRLYADEDFNINEIAAIMRDKSVLGFHGNPISFSTVARMLRNRRYLGEYRFDKTVVKDGIPRIVDDGIFERARMKLEKNEESPSHYRAPVNYLLSGKLFCGKCGGIMQGESSLKKKSGKTYRYYKCTNTKKNHTCDAPSVDKSYVEGIAVHFAKGLLFDDRVIKGITESVLAFQSRANPVLKALEKSKEDAEKRIANLVRAVEEGIISDSTKTRLAELEEQKKGLEAAIGNELIQNPVLDENDILMFFDECRALDLKKEANRQLLIDLFIEKMIIYPDGGGHIILNYKKISRECSFSRGGSNTETNASPFVNYRTSFSLKNGFGFSFGF